ncbi:MAG: sulfatase-like hydrolase/transferase, partial [Verrucomicrobiae bacterium]|nr:sulfatase-like hydrolase/transferase [Verrucomicrobiae bacterium]
AKQWIIDHQAAQPTQPFFLYLAFDTPHAVLELPTQAYPTGAGLTGGLQWLGTPGHMINTASGTIDSYLHPDYASATYDHDHDPATPEVAWPDVYRRYATDVRRIDDCVGDLVQLLQDLAIDDRTLIVFTTDNGPSQESYLDEPYHPDFFNSFGPFDGIKRDVWEGGIRVGALARWPGGIPANRVSNVPCGAWDWLSTFAELAGVPVPARSDGRSLVPSLTGVGVQVPPTVYIEYYQNGTTPSYDDFAPVHRGRRRNQMQMIRLGDIVGLRYNVNSPADNFEIYDIVQDPQQLTNLVRTAAHGGLNQQMKDRVLQLRRPNSSASRPYDAAPVPGVTVSPVTPGVEWRAFSGAFPWVPEFTAMAPETGGAADLPTLDVRPRDSDLGLLFTGYLSAPAEGDYTFTLTADTGALLRIHEATVIDADFGHAPGSGVSGTINLKAGLHPFRLYYVRGSTGTPALSFEWSGPGFAKEPIPASAFRRDGTPPAGPPEARDDSASTAQEEPVDISVLANDEDDGTPEGLRIVSVDSPAGGTAEIVEGGIRYTPSAGFLGRDAFRYVITDGAATAEARVGVEVFFEDPELLWLPLNQFSGLRVVESGGREVGGLGGYSDPTGPWVEGRFGRAARFNGSGQQITLDASYVPPAGAEPRTLAAWIQATPGTTGAIVAWGENAATRKWYLRLDNAAPHTGALRLEVSGGYVIGTRELSDGLWHHVVCTFLSDQTPDVTEVRLYVDGGPETISASQSQTVDTDGTNVPVTIGVDGQSRYFDGLIDEVRIYRRALGPAEIAELAAATRQVGAAWNRRFFGNAPLAWSADDEGDGANRLLEYGLGGQPHVADANVIRPVGEMSGDGFEMRYRRPRARDPEVHYQARGSPDLQDWNLPTVSEVGDWPDLSGELLEEVRVRTDPLPGEPGRLFLQLQVGLE